MNEYQLEAVEALKSHTLKTRTAEHTRTYAVECRNVGKELGVVVLDLWSIFVSLLMIKVASFKKDCTPTVSSFDQ